MARSGLSSPSGKLTAEVGTVLPLEEAQSAHEILAGAPLKRGKIVLRMQESNGQTVS